MKKTSIIALIMTLLIFVSSQTFSIINGNLETGYPFTGSIKDTSIYGGFSTGNLIDRSWVLTAAHNIHGKDPEDLFFQTGSNSNAPDATYSIDRIVICPSYDDSTYEHDIGLLHLASPAAGIEPGLISSSDLSALTAGNTIIQAGYGAYDIFDHFDGRKRSCSSIIEDLNIYSFTAGSTSSPWAGDSGGPCLWNNSGKTYIIGIITQAGEAGGTYFSVNARISQYYTFISDAISHYNNPPSKPVLFSPDNGGTNIESPVAFRWLPCADADGDNITYQIYLSENSDLSDPIIQDVSGIILNLQDKKAFSFLLMIILFIPVCFKRNRRILINLMKILLFCLFISCVSYSYENKDDEKDNANYITHEINGLIPGTVYYWRITAKDEHNAVTNSDIWSFTTK